MTARFRCEVHQRDVAGRPGLPLTPGDCADLRTRKGGGRNRAVLQTAWTSRALATSPARGNQGPRNPPRKGNGLPPGHHCSQTTREYGCREVSKSPAKSPISRCTHSSGRPRASSRSPASRTARWGPGRRSPSTTARRGEVQGKTDADGLGRVPGLSTLLGLARERVASGTTTEARASRWSPRRWTVTPGSPWPTVRRSASGLRRRGGLGRETAPVGWLRHRRARHLPAGGYGLREGHVRYRAASSPPAKGTRPLT